MTDQEIETLWREGKDTPFDEDENIDVDWHIWKRGTNRYETWHWFDENHSKGVGWLMENIHNEMSNC